MLIGIHNPDMLTPPTLGRKWTETGGLFGSSPGTPSIRADGYGGRNAYTCTDGDHAHLIKAPIHPGVSLSSPGSYMGCRYLFEEWPATPLPLLGALDWGGSLQILVALNFDGTLSIYRGPLTTHLLTTAVPLSLDTYYRMGMIGSVTGPVGDIAVHVGAAGGAFNQVMRFNSGPTFQDVGSANWRAFYFGLPHDCACNHVYWGDTTGSQPTLIPNVIALPFLADQADFVVEWDKSGSAAFGTMVDDPTPDDMATFIGAANDQAAYLLKMADAGSPVTVYGVQHNVMIQNRIGTTHAFRHILARASGVATWGSVDDTFDFSVSSTWGVSERMFSQAMGSLGWNPAELELARFGGRFIRGG